jgi:hypothetical protein
MGLAVLLGHAEPGEFRGLACRDIRELPALIYFHENQLTYPVRVESERDYQFAMTNMTSALAAMRYGSTPRFIGTSSSGRWMPFWGVCPTISPSMRRRPSETGRASTAPRHEDADA